MILKDIDIVIMRLLKVALPAGQVEGYFSVNT
jgi:hypothetical protein